MPVERAFNWDPNTIVGRSIVQENWRGVSEQEKSDWLMEMNSNRNLDTFVSKLIAMECFLTIILRDGTYYHKFIVLEDFQRFVNGPAFEGPLNWPDQH